MKTIVDYFFVPITSVDRSINRFVTFVVKHCREQCLISVRVPGVRVHDGLAPIVHLLCDRHQMRRMRGGEYQCTPRTPLAMQSTCLRIDKQFAEKGEKSEGKADQSDQKYAEGGDNV